MNGASGNSGDDANEVLRAIAEKYHSSANTWASPEIGTSYNPQEQEGSWQGNGEEEDPCGPGIPGSSGDQSHQAKLKKKGGPLLYPRHLLAKPKYRLAAKVYQGTKWAAAGMRRGLPPVKKQHKEKKRLLEFERRIFSHMRSATLPEKAIQASIFKQPINSQAKLRRKRPRFVCELNRTESSRNPNNPFQDTSDSELDEIESELELEQEYLKQIKEGQEPKLQLEQDGDVCFYCGALTPYEMRKTTPYPAFYQCAKCRQSQMETVLSKEAIDAHIKELQVLEGNIRLTNNGWYAEEPTLLRSQSPMKSESEYMQLAEAKQTLQSELYDSRWDSIVENTNRGPSRWKVKGLTQAEQYAKYWSKGRALVAGGMAWTVEEGNLFFQGLRRFGKHNVWAIQEHIRSRSLAEVVAMIQTMEMELARRKHFGLEMIGLDAMPMAEEADENQIDIEERCAAILIDRESRRSWQESKKATSESKPEVVQKIGLFNLRTLTDLSSRLYIQNEGAGIEREVAIVLYDAVKQWLTPVMKELVTLHHERHRVNLLLNKEARRTEIRAIGEMDVIRTLYAQQKALGSFEFFESMPERNKFLLYDDRPEFIRSQRRRLRSVNPNFVADGLGKKYYLNEEVDLAKALAPDSDQDVETDDGVSAEEQAEVELEAPHAVVRESLLHSPNSLTNVYSQEKSELRHWDTFWSTTARNARQVTPSERKRYRFRETHPLVPVPMDFDTWQEGVQRLAANSHALPMAVATDAGLSTVDTAYDAPVQSMNKTKRTFEQSLYFEKKGYVEKHKPHDVKFARVEKYAERMAEKARTVPVRPLETYSPGYGVLPKNTSFMYDATRTPPKNGYGLGERNVGGLWFKDKKSNGYITVSDSEDEEEEERGWQRQMQADLQIEQASSNHGVGE